MTSFKQFLEEELRNKKFAEAYEEARAELKFGLALAMRRDELGLTQQALAEATGIKQPMLARIEHGQMPTAPTLQRLAKGLNVNILIADDAIRLLPKPARTKRKAAEKEDSAEMYVKMAEIDFAYKQEIGGTSNPYKGSKDATISFSARGVLR